IAHSRGLKGHSDADVLSHAIADALLGAIGAGDIGQHFPNTDESIRGMSSIEILRDVNALLTKNKARAINVDATILAEGPKIQPRDPAQRKISIYTCGPTVYSRAHIGNFRAYIFEDLLQRHLELRGYKVHRVMNITDVDDKTIRGTREAKIPLSKFTAQFKEAFFEDIETLRIKRADDFPAATDQRYIDKMIEMIAALISRGL